MGLDNIKRGIYSAGMEEPFDAVGVPDADLGMVFFFEPGSRIDIVSLPENSPHGVETFPVFSFTFGVKKVDYRAIKLSQQEVAGRRTTTRLVTRE